MLPGPDGYVAPDEGWGAARGGEASGGGGCRGDWRVPGSHHPR